MRVISTNNLIIEISHLFIKQLPGSVQGLLVHPEVVREACEQHLGGEQEAVQ